MITVLHVISLYSLILLSGCYFNDRKILITTKMNNTKTCTAKDELLHPEKDMN